MANTHKKIQTVTVGAGGASSISFTSIPQTYTDLRIVWSGRSNRAAAQDGMKLQFNGTTTGYADISLTGNGATASSGSNGGSGAYIYGGVIPSATATSSTFGNIEYYIPNYVGSAHKSLRMHSVAENNTTTAYAVLEAGLWSNTSAITSVTIASENAADFVQYTTATLYGVFKANVTGAPSAPTSVTATNTGTGGVVSVAFTPAGQTAASFTVTSSPGSFTATGTASPISVSGLNESTAYTFTVTAANPLGSATSSASGAVTPAFSFPTQGALFSSGYGSSAYSSVISYVDITTAGNSLSFGNLALTPAAYGSGTGCASSTRGVHLQGNVNAGALYKGIQYSTFATKGDGINFGNSTDHKSNAATCSSSTRGVTMGGTNNVNPPPSNFGTVSYGLEYITIATTGNATSFGTSTYPTDGLGGCASSTRGVFGGRTTAVYGRSIDIEYITIASTGNTTNFGNCTTSNNGCSAASSSTRGIFAGGGAGSANQIDYITIASTGNATSFGTLTTARQYMGSNASVAGTTKILIAGGYTGTAPTFSIDQITTATTGNATAFGNLLASGGAYILTGMSNSHGGL